MSTEPENTETASFGARAFAGLGLAAGWILIGVPATTLAAVIALELLARDVAAAIDSRVDPTQVNLQAALTIAVVLLTVLNVGFIAMRRKFGWSALFSGTLSTLGSASVVAGLCIVSAWSRPEVEVAKLFAWSLQVTAVAALVVVWLGAKVAGGLWRLSRRHSSASVILGISVGASSVVSAAMVLVIIAAMIAREENLDDTASESPSFLAGLVVFYAEDGREYARARRLATEAQLISPFASLLSTREAHASDDWDELIRNACFEALATRKVGEADSKIDQAARFLRLRAGLSFEDARDHASDKALHVCTTSAFREPEEARAYYWRSIQNTRVDALRSGRARRSCTLTPGIERRLTAPDVLGRAQELWREHCFETARCRLSEKDQSLLTLCVEFSLRELEARGVASRSEAQRRCNAVKDRVRRSYQTLCSE